MIKHWREQSVCFNHPNPDLWYPEEGDTYGEEAAIAQCRTCPIRRKCLSHAMVNDEEFGVWGGKTREERVEYLPHFKRTVDLPEVVATYRREEVAGNAQVIYERRLGLAKQIRATLKTSDPRYDAYRQLVDVAIANPETPLSRIAVMIHRSRSWVELAWNEMEAAVA